MVDEYDYVAIGGFANSDEINKKDYKYLFWFLNEAHKKNCKVHALGFTGLKDLEIFPFDSVDSTSWLYGNLSGTVLDFKKDKMEKIKAPKGMRLKDYKQVASQNFYAWVKYSRYIEKLYKEREIKYGIK